MENIFKKKKKGNKGIPNVSKKDFKHITFSTQITAFDDLKMSRK